MPLLLTSTLPFLAHDHASAVAFLTCRHHNFHTSIIPEFLSNEERVKTFCETPQQNEPEEDNRAKYENSLTDKSTKINMRYSVLFNLFIQTPLMQFSPSLVLRQKDSAKSILKPLLETKYFCRTLQRCSFFRDVKVTNDLVEGLSKVQFLTELDLGESVVRNEQLEIIINSFPDLETLAIRNAGHLRTVDPNTAIHISSPPPPATATLRNLTMRNVNTSFATQFLPRFTNLRKLQLVGREGASQKWNLEHLLASLSLLTDLSLHLCMPSNIESLKNLVHLQSIEFTDCRMPQSSLGFLTQQENNTNTLPRLTTLSIHGAGGGLPTSSSYAPLSNAPILYSLNFADNYYFNDDCLKYLEKMIHLRKLDLSTTQVTGNSQSLRTLMENLFQLEELNLEGCRGIGNNQGGIAGALYIPHSRLRVLNLSNCNLVDDDLNGISALKNTLEVLHLNCNRALTSEGLVHCKDLVKLKNLTLSKCVGVSDLSPLKECLNLEELDVLGCASLTDDSFAVFGEEPNSFRNLRIWNLWYCKNLKKEVLTSIQKK